MVCVFCGKKIDGDAKIVGGNVYHSECFYTKSEKEQTKKLTEQYPWIDIEYPGLLLGGLDAEGELFKLDSPWVYVFMSKDGEFQAFGAETSDELAKFMGRILEESSTEELWEEWVWHNRKQVSFRVKPIVEFKDAN